MLTPVFRIRDVYSGSRIRIFASRIRIFSVPDPEFKYFSTKKWFPSTRKHDPVFIFYPGSWFFYPSRIQGPKNAPDPQHWSTPNYCYIEVLTTQYLHVLPPLSQGEGWDEQRRRTSGRGSRATPREPEPQPLPQPGSRRPPGAQPLQGPGRKGRPRSRLQIPLLKRTLLERILDFFLVFSNFILCNTQKIPVSPQDGPLCVHLLCKPSHVHPSNFGDFALSATSRNCPSLRSNYPFLPSHEKCSAIFASRCQRNRHTTQPPIRRIFESSFLLPLTTSRFDPPLSSVDKVHIFLYYFWGLYLFDKLQKIIPFNFYHLSIQIILVS